MDESAPYWFPVATLALGAALAFLADWLREGRGARRQRRAAADAFERETLIALQDALARIGLAALVLHQYDERIYQQTGRWGREVHPEGMLETFGSAANDVTLHRVRVRDDGIREGARDFASWCVIAQTGAQGDESDADARELAAEARAHLSPFITTLHEQIGERVRELL